MSKPITIKILGDSSQFDDAMRGVNSKLGGLGKSLGGISKAIGLGVGAIAVGAVAIGVSAVNSLIRIEKINAQTKTVIDSMGASTWTTQQHIEGLAGSLESLTGIEAEAIQEGQNLLLTFGNVTNSAGEGNDVFDQATKLMVDMGVAMGTDASASAIQLGKALNDPVAGITALTRVGVSFTDQQKEQIKALAESGDVLGAQKIILSELENQFGGSAEAFGQTTAGKIERLKHAFGTITEAIVSKLLPPLTKLVDWLLKMATAAEPWAEEIGPKVKQVFEDIAAKVEPLIQKVIPVLVKWFNKLTDNGKDMTPVLAGIGAVLAMLIVPAMLSLAVSVVTTLAPILLVVAAVAALAAGLVYAYRHVEGFRNAVDGAVKWFTNDALPALKAFGLSVVEMFKSAFEAVSAVVTTVVAVIMKIWDGFGSDLVSGIKRYLQAVWDVLNGFVKIFTGIFDLLKAIFTGKWGEAWEAVKQIVTGALEVIWGVLRAAITIVGTTLQGLRTVIAAAFTTAWNMALTAVSDGWGKVWGFIAGIPSALVGLASGWWNSGSEMGSKLISGLVSGLSAAGGFVSDVGEAIRNTLIGAVNWVIDKMNSAIPDSISLPGPVPDIDLPDNPIPRVNRAMGGPASGWVRAGERGAEDIYLPKGSHVRAAHEAGGSSGNIYVDVQSNADPFAIANELAWALRINGR